MKLKDSSASSSTTARDARPSSFRSGTYHVVDRYLHDVAQLPLMDDAANLEIGRRIDAAERLALQAIVACPVARRELAAIARDLLEERTRYIDVAHIAPSGQSGAEVGEPSRVAAELLLRAARSARALAAVEPLVRLRLSRQTFHRIARRLDDTRRASSSAAPDALEATADAIRRGVADADRAKGTLAERNLRLVVYVAKHFRARGLALEDLVQEGNLGLLRAIDKFDYTRGFKFTTYATWWIKQSIRRGIVERGTMIRLPVHAADARARVMRCADAIARREGRSPTDEEVARAADVPVEKARALLDAQPHAASLDVPVGSEAEGTTRLDLLESAQETPEAEATASQRRVHVEALLVRLPPRERRVLQLRFGFDGAAERSLEEVGRVLGVTRERVRQIEKAALARLGAMLPSHFAERA